jgi:hypoxanthine phosphoribosyltransferase
VIRSRKLKSRFSARKIAARIEVLGKLIRQEAGPKPILFIGVLKGATFFLSDLIRATAGDVSYTFIAELLDTSDTLSAEAQEIDFLSAFDIRDRNVYLLKDVVSTGIIENYLMTHLRQRGPADLKLVALLDRPEVRTIDLQTDYYGFMIDDGTYAGYGLEVDGKYANLPYIATVT